MDGNGVAAGKVIGVTGAAGLLGRAWIEWALDEDPDLRVLALVRPSLSVSPWRWLGSISRAHRRRITAVN